MSSILQTLGIVLFWLVLIGLFFTLYTYLGTLIYRWYQERKKEQGQKKES